MTSLPSPLVLRRRIRCLLLLFIVGLMVSGATAIPLTLELDLLGRWIDAVPGLHRSALAVWIDAVRSALGDIDVRYPFLAYGTDWLAFGHFAIAVAFLGPLRDPIRNVWVVTFGMIACVLVIPYALVLGFVRHIPFFWRLIDCSFGVLGFIPLWFCRRDIRELERRI